MCSFGSCQTRFEFLSQFRKVRNAFECFVTQVQTHLPKTKRVWPMKIYVICTVFGMVMSLRGWGGGGVGGGGGGVLCCHKRMRQCAIFQMLNYFVSECHMTYSSIIWLPFSFRYGPSYLIFFMKLLKGVRFISSKISLTINTDVRLITRSNHSK